MFEFSIVIANHVKELGPFIDLWLSDDLINIHHVFLFETFEKTDELQCHWKFPTEN